MSGRFRTLAAALGCAACCAVVVAPAPAAADGECSTPGKTIEKRPWAQEMLNPDRVRPFTDGSGVKVAILDGGVDGNQPQLKGHVDKGKVIKVGSSAKRADTDCTGSGTQVAGVIAAQPSTKTAFHGVAPGVTIVPVRQSDVQSNSPPTAGSADSIVNGETEALAIATAITLDVDIIELPVVADDGNKDLKRAVELAQERDIVVIAAVGDNSDSNTGRPSRYPACYPGVIGVGAIQHDGTVMQSQRPNSCVDLVAPGVSVTTTQLNHGLVKANGTHVASGFVAATAALVRARYPEMSAADVKRQLDGTATPAAGDMDSKTYGHGVVNPYDAVTETMTTASPAALPPMHRRHKSGAELAWDNAWSSSSRTATILTGAGLLLALMIVLGAASFPRGRRLGWRPRQGPPPVDDPEADMPSPPVNLFKESETSR